VSETQTVTPTSVSTVEKLREAYKGSYYCIAGAGGDLTEWTQGYNAKLEEEGIGTPVEWFATTGSAVNLFAARQKDAQIIERDQFPLDLTILLFPLDGLNVGRLAYFKLAMEDRWFDDVIDNMRRRA